jgi:hypothetical protein
MVWGCRIYIFYVSLSWEARMFSSFFVGAVYALLAAFLIAAIGKWAGLQPNRVVIARWASSSHAMATVVSVDGAASTRSTISSRLMYEGGALHGGVLGFLVDASDWMRDSAQRSSI